MSKTQKIYNLFKEQAYSVDIKNISFFNNFSNDLLEKIISFSTSKLVDQGEEIIKEGSYNNILFFLMSGVLGVYVKGELVAKIEEIGEVFGEMSVISSKPTSATITALTRTELLCINVDSFNSLSIEDSNILRQILYKLFCSILTERLVETNEKARQFEITNRRLKEAQQALQEAYLQLEKKVEERTADLIERTEELAQKNTAMMASYRKLEDLAYTKRSIFNKLSELYKNHLMPLKITLNNLMRNSKDEFKSEITLLNRELENVQSFIKPLISAFFLEKSIQSKNVLLLEVEKKQQIITKMALGGTGVELDIASNIEEGRELLNNAKYDIICTGYEFLDLMKLAVKNNPDVKIVFMTSDDAPTYLRYLKQYSDLSSVVARSEDDRLFTIKNIITTVSKIANEDYFGLEKYLGWGVEVKEYIIKTSDQRKILVDQMIKYFEEMGIRRSLLERCETVAEELLMNVIYDAPIDENGKSIYNHLPRNVKVELKPEEQGLFRFACDGALIAISVQDPFGALDRNTIISYLDGCYGGHIGSMNEKKNKGGAGMGLFQLIGTSDLVVFNVQPRLRTEVIALFNADLSKAKSVKNPSFHFFFY